MQDGQDFAKRGVDVELIVFILFNLENRVQDKEVRLYRMCRILFVEILTGRILNRAYLVQS